jgi:hypothetical protein
MKTLTRTVRLAVGVVAMLAITAQVAQARPCITPTTQSGSPSSAAYQGTITASARATDLIMRSQTSTRSGTGVTPAATGVDRTGTDLARTPVLPTVVVHASDPGFDWTAAMAGAGSVLAIMLLAAVAVTARGRRRIAVSN